mgnify:CR=1 FL=1|tara:strand:+ start:1359 stop:1733 length:375 start_codon:yes stop_codon:yes gene_type:complete
MVQILIVEDEQAIREALKEILEMSGYKVITANNGKEGYERVLDNKPDLILSDINMPEWNGYELLAAINKLFKDTVSPIFIFLTARLEKYDARQAMEMGANAYINKPYHHTELLSIIASQLNERI